MNWLYKLLGIKEEEPTEAGSTVAKPNGSAHAVAQASPTAFAGVANIRFGRYSDNNKSQSKTQSWYIAEDRFKEKRYTEAFAAFFDYLRDDEEQNVSVQQEGDSFQFTIFQGSKKVHGTITGETITAQAPLAMMQEPSAAVMRRLLEMNYSLYYSHSGLDDSNVLHMVFLADVASTNPSKLYYALRELATNADRQDDLLLTDFPALLATDNDHLQYVPDAEVDIKFKFFRKWIEETLTQVNDLNQDSFSGAIGYLLLTLIYRIDFLLQPETKLLAELNKINGFYWDKKDEIAVVARNQMMKDALRKLLDISKEDFAKSLYRTRYTFSLATPPKADKVREHIASANKSSIWYVENKFPELALVINEYGMLYNQFLYSMPSLQTELITIYMAVRHADFFAELGLKQAFYDATSGQFNQQAIMNAIDAATNRYTDKFPSMKWEHERVSYESLYDFGVDFSEQLASLNLETKRN